MSSLDKVEIEFKCPKCGFSNKASLRQVRLGEIIICSGCHGDIKLVDKDASTHKGITMIEQSLKDLKRAIDEINRR